MDGAYTSRTTCQTAPDHNFTETFPPPSPHQSPELRRANACSR
ncbi:hypothetical protein PDR5_57720 [Pseudomonas sp. DR 5-09]|nr:hypothetical protein PDR5_57720 [Pseudomonas sp. DR 5-09]